MHLPKLPGMIALCLTLLCLNINGAQAADYPDEMKRFLSDMLPRFNQARQNSNLLDADGVAGLWIAEKSDDNSDIDRVHFSSVGPFLMEIVPDRQTGNLAENNVVGFAERAGQGWSGWFSVVCKNCCPGISWWDKGIVQIDPAKTVMQVTINTIKLDPKTCQFTDTPDQVILRSKRLRKFKIGDIAPGKKIHIVAAPAVGNNSAQYKAAMKLEWSYPGLGIAAIDIAARNKAGGQLIVNKSANQTGTFEYVTTRAGGHKFLLIGYNSAGQPIHFEETAITVPPIPGLNSSD